MSARQWTFVVWGLLGAVVVLCAAIATLSKGRFPTAGQVVSQLTARRAGRVLAVVVWMWLGWHAFAR